MKQVFNFLLFSFLLFCCSNAIKISLSNKSLLKTRQHGLDSFNEIVQSMFFAEAAYVPEKVQTSYFKVHKIINNPDINGQALIVSKVGLNRIYVSFRGTSNENTKNLLTDLKFIKTVFSPCGECNIHRGFSYFIDELKDEIDDALVDARKALPNADIFVVGHSLGGASATLYATHILRNYSDLKGKVYLYTFGSPRLGNEQFKNYTEETIGLNRIFRVTYRFDPVAYIPHRFLRYRHVGIHYNFTDYENFENRGHEDIESVNIAKYLIYIRNHSRYWNITASYNP